MKAPVRLLLCLLLAGELCVPADIALALWGRSLPVPALLGALLLLTLLFFFFGPKGRGAAVLPAALAGLFLAAGLAVFLLWRVFVAGAVYQDTDRGKSELYGGKKVLLVAPHQDDDLNLLGGVLEQYIQYGSQVKVLYVTAGDYKDVDSDAFARITSARRVEEALEVLSLCGVPEEDVIFLGYGDQWDPEGPHIYNAAPDQVLRAYAGYTSTHASPEHPAYHEGALYTRRNLLNDLMEVIRDYEPDVLFSCDFDAHIDHMATSLFFEEAVGRILAEKPDYEPVVLKGFAYSLAYNNEADFYRPNIGAVANPYGTPYMSETNNYRWEDRVRLPVSAAGLSRSLLNADGYQKAKLYASQGIRLQAERIINGDKVFWQRDTSSLSYEAELTASSGEAWRLNDFKLCDSDDLTENAFPSDGTWVPEAGDTERRAELTLAESADLCLLRLYDSPSETDNVLDALLVFDDGTQLHTGPLDPMGAATEFRIDKKNVTSFSIQLLETEGEQAGLAEIEVYDREPDSGLRFIKLQNREGDFVYDYYIDRSGTEDFSLYAMGAPEELSGENYTVSLEGEGCRAELLDGKLRVECPAGKSCTVTVRSADGSLADSVRISNPSPLRNLGQRIEAYCRHHFADLRQSASYRLLRDAYHLLRG